MKKLLFSLTLLAFVPLVSCSKPVLKQVDSDAAEKPINTPEMAERLKKQYEK